MKKKIIISFIIFLILNLFVSFNQVFCATETINYNYNNVNYTINFDDDGSIITYFIICNKSTGVPERFIYHYSDNSFKYYYNSDNNLVIQKMDNDSYFYLNPKKTADNTYLMKWGGFKRDDLIIDLNNSIICYSNKPILHKDTNIELNKPFNKPYIANTDEDLATGNFNYVLVLPGSLSSNDSIGIKLNKVNTIKYDLDGDGTEEEHESFELLYKTQLSSYIKYEGDLFWYEFPQSSFGINFKEGDRFCLQLVNDINKIYLEEDYILYQEIYFTIGGLSEDDKANNRVNSIIESNKKTEEAIKNQTEAIKEQTETNKNIFETIKSIVNFLNPFSEDFFVYKLIELLFEMLKSLFVPSDDFFNNWFSDLNSWLGDRFGILYFPIEIVLDFLNRIGSMSVNSDYILHIPDVSIDFFGNNLILINSFDYDFNSLLTNDTFKNIHTIYLTIVDVILYLCLIVLSYNTFVDVFGGHYIDDALHDGYDYYESSKIEKQQKEKSSRIGFRG